MQQGLHSAITEYVALSREVLGKIKDAISENGLISSSAAIELYNSEEMKLLRDMENYYLFDPLKESSTLVEDDYVEAANGMRLYHNLLMSLFVVICMFMFLFLYNPMISRLGLET
jgi:hypothetical protein